MKYKFLKALMSRRGCPASLLPFTAGVLIIKFKRLDIRCSEATMPVRITIEAGPVVLDGELFDTATARAVAVSKSSPSRTTGPASIVILTGIVASEHLISSRLNFIIRTPAVKGNKDAGQPLLDISAFKNLYFISVN